MIQTHTVYIEVKLTEFQIFERRLRLEQELDEQDKLTGQVDSKKLEIKDTNVAIERVTSRVRQLRREIRLGYIVEAREAQLKLPDVNHDDPQQYGYGAAQDDPGTADTLTSRPTDPGIDAAGDGYSPDPQTDPPNERDTMPPPPARDLFAELYPMARTHGALRDYLFDVLTDVQYAKLPNGTVESWPVATGVFDAIAHWARVEKARADGEKRAKASEPTIDGLYIPVRVTMPGHLEALINAPSSSDRKPAKKARKRRSGSTANSD